MLNAPRNAFKDREAIVLSSSDACDGGAVAKLSKALILIKTINENQKIPSSPLACNAIN